MKTDQPAQSSRITSGVILDVVRICFCLLGGILLIAAGCNSGTDETGEEKKSETVIRKISVKMLVIGDESLGPVIKRQFSSRRDGEVELSEMTWDEFVAGDCQAASDTDVVIYPARRLGELASRDLLVPINDDNTRFEEGHERALLFSDRGQAVSWAGQQVAMSLGQTHWVTLYRSDVLKSVSGEPAETWSDFDKLVKRISESGNADLPKRIAIPTMGHWAGHSLMVRAASAIRTPGKYSTYFDVGSMQPLIATSPFQLSLQAWKDQVEAQEAQDPQQILADFRAGKIAVAVVPLNRHWLASGEGGAELPEITIGGVPGWKSVFDGTRNSWTEQLPGAVLSVPQLGTCGMLASCSTGSSQKRNTLEVISWMTSKKICSIVSVESANAGMSRKSHLGNAGKWLGDEWTAEQLTQYSDYLNEVNSGRRVMTTLRIPESDRYLDELDQAVRAVISSDADVAESLTGVTTRWTEITNEIGMEKQKMAYRQSEGMQQ